MPPRKRAAAQSVPLTPAPSGRRRSQRASSSASKYFEAEEDDEEEEVPQPKRARGRRAVSESDGSAYEEGDSEGEDEEETGDGGSKNEDDDDGDDDNDDDDDAPAKVTFIPHKALRDLGDTPYADDRLHPVTMRFLQDLKANNRRNWLKENDAEFRRAQKDWQTYVLALAERIAADVDDTIPAELPPQDVIFRVYRDIRFSKDPRPYKPHFSAAWSRTGKKGPYAVYYVHCEPRGPPGAAATKGKSLSPGEGSIGDGGCFVAGGLWHPPADALRRLRASIDERPRRWRRVLAGDGRLRAAFFPGVAADADAEAVLAAFCRMNAREALKKGPVGFAGDHRDIGLLKLRNFTLVRAVPDALLTDEGGREQLLALLQAMQPFVAHLNAIVRPDGNEEEDDED